MGAADANNGFANISAGSGLDFPDDGRGVALSDWDRDGDLDLWISNRNAPRLRFLRNDTPSTTPSLMVRLQGSGHDTNRDAIGARVELLLAPDANATASPSRVSKQIRTVRAGNSFLSQSSKWLHFGLGTAKSIQQLVVYWPCRGSLAERREVFTGLRPGGRYLVAQGTARAMEVPQVHAKYDLQPSTPSVPAPSQTARVPAVTLLRGPRFKIRGSNGEIVSPGEGNSILINLFASWCPTCMTELANLRDRERDIRAAGIQVLALSVDGLGDDGSNADTARKALEQMDFPFVSAVATRELLDNLQGYHNALVTLQRPLPLPTSFLIDNAGRVAVMYKGPLNVNVLITDVGHSSGTRLERWKRAALLPGRTMAHETVVQTAETVEAAMHFQFGLHQLRLNSLSDALYHFQQAIQIKPDFVAAQRFLATVYLQQGDARSAERHLRRALQSAPNDPETHWRLATLHLRQRNLAAARAEYEQTLRLKADHVGAMFDLGVMLHTLQGDVPAALRLYRDVIRIDPNHAGAHNNLAWLLATHPDEETRDGPYALRLAQRVVQTRGESAMSLDLLAAAQAECEMFAAATETARKALELARLANDETLAQQIERRIAGYDRGQAHRESPVIDPASD